MSPARQVASPAPKRRKRRKRAHSKVARLFWQIAEVAVAIGWTTEKTRDTFLAAKPTPAAQKLGGRWYTSRGHLKRMFPHDYLDVIARLPQ